MSPAMVSAATKELHDRLLAEQPEGATHDIANCAVCAMHTDGDAASGRPDGGDMTTFSQEQVAQAVEEATAPLRARVTELEGLSRVAEVDAAIAEVRKPLEEELATTRAALDTAVVEAQTEKDRADGLVAWLESESQAAAAAATIEQRRTARIEEAKAVVAFEEEYLAANAGRWAEMDDEVWAATLDSWRAIAAKVPAVVGSGEESGRPPVTTGLSLAAGRETAGADPRRMSAVREVLDLRNQGIDPRTLSALNR